MEKPVMIEMYLLADPSKRFYICDLDSGPFADPLEIYSSSAYDPHNVNDKGCFAYGGDIYPETLIESYSMGIFPWYPYREIFDVYWYCPKERYVIYPEKIHVGHSLRNLMNKHSYRLTVNEAFEEVMNHCRTVNKRHEHEDAWLGEDLIKSFITLKDKGYAKSVELWDGDTLIGGFYGFWKNGVFQGDSMFSLRPSASQIALVMLCRKGEIDGEKLKFIDTQYETETFKRLGGEYITYKSYRKSLEG